MITPITATFPALNFPKEVDYPTQEDWAAFSAAAELNYGILSGAWSDKSEEFKEQTNNLALEIQAIGENAINAITFDNIAQLKLNSNMNRVDVLGYYTKGDGGGGTFYWDSTSTEADNGGIIIQATGITTGRWKRPNKSVVNVKEFGAKGDGVTDDTLMITRLIDYCIFNNITYVNNDFNIMITADVPNAQEVIFVGEGSFIGLGSEKIRQVTTNDKESTKSTFGFEMSQLPASCRAIAFRRPLNVVIVGDSLTTKTVDVKSRDASQYDAMARAFIEQNPNIDFNFKSRGIGGQTFTNLNGLPSAFPDWYTDTGRPWLDYCADETPDLVIVSMGMNGSLSESNPSLLSEIYQKILAFSSSPDVIFCTTPLPSSYDSNPTIYNTYCSPIAQKTRQGVAGLVRNFCRMNNIPFFDVNRQFNLLREGFDIRKSYISMLSSEKLTGSFSSGAFTSPVTTRDFSLVVTMPGRLAYRTVGQTLALCVGPTNPEVVFIGLTAANKLTISFYDREMTNYKVIAYDGTNNYPDIEIPDSSHILVCEVYDSKVRIYPTTATTDSIPLGELLMASGEKYIPKLGSYESGFDTGNISALLEFGVGINYKYFPELNNREMYGSPDGSVGLKSPSGGNGVNHFSSKAAHKLYYDTFMMSNLNIAGVNTIVESASATQWVRYRNGKIVEMGGKTVPVVGASVNIDITFPISLAGSGYSLAIISFSAGSPITIANATVRDMQHVVSHGEPTDTGCWANLQSLNYITSARYATWRLDIIY